MQELTFEQVEVVSGGSRIASGQRARQERVEEAQQLEGGAGGGGDCRSYNGQPLSPGVVGAASAAIGYVSSVNPYVGAALAGGFGWLAASAAQGGTTCGTPMTNEQVIGVINRGLATGGPF